MFNIEESVTYYREQYQIIIYAFQKNETGYWAHSLEGKAKYDSWEEAMILGIEEAAHRVKNQFYMKLH